jgi:nucleotide-binding universal stress UspA family protein
MTIHEILFATDFSPASQIVGRVARDLALKMDASLRVIHVVPQGGDPWKSAVALTDAANTLGAGAPADTALLSGRAAREIVAHARDKHVDMIVMGTHGQTGLVVPV